MTRAFDSFDPFSGLAEELGVWLPEADDGSHDIGHLARVWRFARHINESERADPLILFAATFLHDCVQIEKNDPQRQFASRLSARRARSALHDLCWPKASIEQVQHAIVAHSVSAGIAPQSPEARILCDADRLDSSGAVGIARCFYVAGRIGSCLFDQSDPAARDRDLNDMSFALDHFQTRLICSTDSFHTKSARRLAKSRMEFAKSFRRRFFAELDSSHDCQTEIRATGSPIR